MKKLYGACVALLLGVLFAFAGCKADGSRVLKYLKAKNFEGNPTSYELTYRINLTVNEDLSYSLSIIYSGADALNDYSATGTKMEYLGYTEEHFTSEWLGVSQNNTNYIHVVKLSEATAEINGRMQAFYLTCESSSKRADSYYTKLVAADSAYGKDNLSQIAKGYPKFTLRIKR